MGKTVKITKQKIKEIIREAIQEELALAGEQEAMNDIFNWMFVANPHGATKQEFLKYLNQDLTKKYGREAVMHAFQKLRQEKGCLIMKKTKAGKEIVVWQKDRCVPK